MGSMQLGLELVSQLCCCCIESMYAHLYALECVHTVCMTYTKTKPTTLNFCCIYIYGTVHRKHDGNSVCRLALFIVTAPLTVNIFDYLLAFNR